MNPGHFGTLRRNEHCDGMVVITRHARDTGQGVAHPAIRHALERAGRITVVIISAAWLEDLS